MILREIDVAEFSLVPGDRFTENEISERLGVSRTPVRQALFRLQQAGTPEMRIRTALVTARSAPAHERAIRTLMNWDIRVDEAMFLGGLPKGEFLREFEPDFFFDDQTRHVDQASRHVPAGHVSSGVANLVPRKGAARSG